MNASGTKVPASSGTELVFMEGTGDTPVSNERKEEEKKAPTEDPNYGFVPKIDLLRRDSAEKILKAQTQDEFDMIVAEKARITEIDYSKLKFVGTKLGSGKFGEVLLAKYRRTRVAVKKFNENDNDFRAKKKEILAELVIASRLDPHPNIIAILGYTLDPVCVVMPYMEGWSVQNYTYRQTNRDSL